MNDSIHAKPPFFSVVIPTHDRPEHLREAVDSVLAQSFTDFELLVVDDRSETPAEEVLADYDDVRLTVMQNERTPGGNGARNSGIFAARGEWIAFLDDDDIWLPAKLERINDKIHNIDANTVFVYSGQAGYDFENAKRLTEKRPKLIGEVASQVLYCNTIGGFSCAVARRNVVQQIGGVDETFLALQDKDFFYRLACQGKFAAVDEILVHMRSEGIRISTNYNKKLAGSLAFLEKHRPTLKQNWRQLHRSTSNVFLFALLAHRWRYVIRSSPIMALGILVDPRNVYKVITRGIIARALCRIRNTVFNTTCSSSKD